MLLIYTLKKCRVSLFSVSVYCRRVSRCLKDACTDFLCHLICRQPRVTRHTDIKKTNGKCAYTTIYINFHIRLFVQSLPMPVDHIVRPEEEHGHRPNRKEYCSGRWRPIALSSCRHRLQETDAARIGQAFASVSAIQLMHNIPDHYNISVSLNLTGACCAKPNSTRTSSITSFTAPSFRR